VGRQNVVNTAIQQLQVVASREWFMHKTRTTDEAQWDNCTVSSDKISFEVPNSDVPMAAPFDSQRLLPVVEGVVETGVG
jgi:hypothetical protein